jgi:hypothetical protein
MTPSPRLSTRLAPEFSAAVRSRGITYFQTQAVNITSGSVVGVEATVRGSEDYQVVIRWEQGTLFMSCNCPFFEDRGPCKHLWATILAADAQGHLTAPRLSRVLNTDFDFFNDPSEESWEEESEDNEFTPFPNTGRMGAAPSTGNSRLPDWRQELAAVDLPGWSSRPSDPWPSRRELLYLVPIDSSSQNGNLHLELVTHDRKKDGGWTKLKELRINRRDVARLPDAEDREILFLLTGARQSYGWGGDYLESLSAHFQVTDPLAGRILERMIHTGRCFCRNGIREPEPLPLTWDEGGAWRLSLAMERQRSGRWAVSGWLHRGGQKISVRDPALVTPGLVFWDNRVSPLEGSYVWVSRLRKQTAIEAPDKEREELLAALVSMPGCPSVEVPEELRYKRGARRSRAFARVASRAGTFLGAGSPARRALVLLCGRADFRLSCRPGRLSGVRAPASGARHGGRRGGSQAVK